METSDVSATNLRKKNVCVDKRVILSRHLLTKMYYGNLLACGKTTICKRLEKYFLGTLLFSKKLILFYVRGSPERVPSHG